MVPKKTRDAPAAQQLIDSLLDERTPSGSAGSVSENAATDASTKPSASNMISIPSIEISIATDHATDHATEMLKPEKVAVDRAGITELKTIVKMRDRYEDQRSVPRGPPAAGGFASSEAALKQSESLRIAQSRITELESEVERLRRENEQLASAGETLRRRGDELLSKSEQFELQVRESERTHSEEKKVYRGQIQAKDREIADLRGRLEEMEGRLESNFKKIRVRERELEHRLEIVRMESQTLVATKDKMILELKRQIDQIMHDNEFAKQKSQEHFNQFKEKQETIRRVVRALRIALTILEGDEDSGMKKPE